MWPCYRNSMHIIGTKLFLREVRGRVRECVCVWERGKKEMWMELKGLYFKWLGHSWNKCTPGENSQDCKTSVDNKRRNKQTYHLFQRGKGKNCNNLCDMHSSSKGMKKKFPHKNKSGLWWLQCVLWFKLIKLMSWGRNHQTLRP